jgi:hypothetical protein
MRRVPLILALLLAARGAGAQTYGPDGRLLVDSEVSTLPANATASGSLTGPTQAVAIASPAGGGSFSVQVTGTWTGQLDFHVTVDGTNWVSKNLYQYASGGQLANATSGNGLFLGSIAGATQFRVYATALSSGTALVTVNVTLADGIGNLIKSVRLNEYTPVSGRLPVDGSGVTQPVSGTVTANAGTGTFATDPTDEDARVLGRTKIHDGTDTALVSGSGSLQVTCDNCGGSTFSDDGAFAGGSTAVLPVAALYDTTPPTITDGNAGIPRMSSTRVLLVDGSGATQPVSGTFWQATQPVSIAAAVTVAQATAANLNATVTDGTGDLTVDGTVAIGTFPDNEPFNLNQVAGSAVATGNGTAAGSVRVALASDGTGQLSTVTTVGTVTNLTNLPNEGQQTAANSISTTLDTDNDPIGATGAAPPGEVVDIGGRTSGADTTGLMTGITVCTDHVAVDVVTATTTLLITGVANRHVRICSINLVTAAANNVALIAGTGATCGTSTAGINGGTTAAEGWNFAANGGLAQGSGFGEIMSTKVSGGATGDSVCVVTSAATQLSGTISYAIY